MLLVPNSSIAYASYDPNMMRTGEVSNDMNGVGAMGMAMGMHDPSMMSMSCTSLFY